jgi:hypothetical protein
MTIEFLQHLLKTNIMKKVFILFVLFFLSTFSVPAGNHVKEGFQDTCFSVAREWVISQEGEINLDNVGHLLELTEYLQTTGICD